MRATFDVRAGNGEPEHTSLPHLAFTEAAERASAAAVEQVVSAAVGEPVEAAHRRYNGHGYIYWLVSADRRSTYTAISQ